MGKYPQRNSTIPKRQRKLATIEELSNKAVEFEAGEKLLNVKLEKLEKQIATSQRKSERLDSKLKKTEDSLKEKTQNDKVEISGLKKELKQLNRKLSDSQRDVKIITSKLDKTSESLDEVNIENKANKTEINRLKDLKWYHKLFGSK